MKANDMFSVRRLSCLLLSACTLQHALAAPVDDATRQRVVRTLAERMAQHCHDAALGRRVADTLLRRLAAHAYDAPAEPQDFASMLDRELRALSGDEHGGVIYTEEEQEPDHPPDFVADTMRTDPEGWLRRRSRVLDAARKSRFGFPKSERLAGNVAYIRIDEFMEPEIVGQVVKAEMAAVRDARALILDLREHGGGTPETGTLLSAWLFDDKPVHLNDQVTRGIGRVLPVWTQPVASDLRFGSRKPVYILVGPDTFSAGENFAYTLQALRRAVVVGAPTRGGAHGGRGYRLDTHFVGSIPVRKTVNPVTGGDWSGAGVQPDVRVDPAQALERALVLARKSGS